MAPFPGEEYKSSGAKAHEITCEMRHFLQNLRVSRMLTGLLPTRWHRASAASLCCGSRTVLVRPSSFPPSGGCLPTQLHLYGWQWTPQIHRSYISARPFHSISPMPRAVAEQHSQNKRRGWWESILQACRVLWTWSAELSLWLGWARPKTTQLHYQATQSNIYLLIVCLDVTSCRASGVADPELTPWAPRAPWLPNSSQWQISQSHLAAFPYRETPRRCTESIFLFKSQQKPTCQDFQLHFTSLTCKGVLLFSSIAATANISLLSK